jgi:hypothetical protein
MSDDEDDDATDCLSLVTNHRPAAKRATPEEAPASAAGDAYATVMGQRTASALKFIRSTGKPVSLPYALLPLVWGDYLPTVLLIEYSGYFTVRLRGIGLNPLEQLITERRVTWIRACSEEEAARLPVAVTGIDLLHYYPSREIPKSLGVPVLNEPEEA